MAGDGAMSAAKLDDLLTAIEGLRSDRKAGFTVLMSAAATCMHNELDQMPDDGRGLGDVEMGFRVSICWWAIDSRRWRRSPPPTVSG
jgi:hypothetical protein